MGFPQITDRMKTAPTHALRAVFSGVGRILLAAERAQREPAGAPGGPAASTPERENQAKSYQTGRSGLSTATTSRWRSLDETGNVRLLSADDLDDDYDALAGVTGTVPASANGVINHGAGDHGAGDHGAGDHGAGDHGAGDHGAGDHGAGDHGARSAAGPLPLTSYDALSVASIRARLRGLDTDQLRTLAEYERSHAERTEVLGMLERRIEKLETGG
jgi:hypothetical protein